MQKGRVLCLLFRKCMSQHDRRWQLKVRTLFSSTAIATRGLELFVVGIAGML